MRSLPPDLRNMPVRQALSLVAGDPRLGGTFAAGRAVTSEGDKSAADDESHKRQDAQTQTSASAAQSKRPKTDSGGDLRQSCSAGSHLSESGSCVAGKYEEMQALLRKKQELEEF